MPDDELERLARSYRIKPDVIAALRSWMDDARMPTLSTRDDEPAGTSEAGEVPTGSPWTRYQDLGRLGEGGMGEVRRVRDLVLDRVLALKLVHARLVDKQTNVKRFVAEARITARIQHPAIVPIHDVGVMPDGRAWFTMKEIRGRTLADLLESLHDLPGDPWRVTVNGWTLRRLVGVVRTVCDAVAYAHEHHVIHRDLKPNNIMVGDHGEVYVVDWGLARLLTPTRSKGSKRSRKVAGTPAWMPPEQARGDEVDERADVYALGALLYAVLSGRPPYVGRPEQILQRVLAGPPPPVGRVQEDASATFILNLDALPTTSNEVPMPAELVDACEHAMQRERRDRPTAAQLGDALQAWLDGTRRREQALELVAKAAERRRAATDLDEKARKAADQARRLLADVPSWAPEVRKAPGWAKATEADAVRGAADLTHLEADQLLQAALHASPGLEEAHAALAETHRARHSAAEARRAQDAVAREEALASTHAAALPDGHPVRRAVTTWLRGDGALTLLTDPPGAEVLLHRYEEHNRRLVESFEGSLGVTPLRERTLPMGSYVAVLRHPQRDPVRYPFEVTRCGWWDGVPPGETEAAPIPLPPLGWLSKEEVYVPPGWFRAGDASIPSLPERRLWCDGLVAMRFPVTVGQYIAFLDDLVARGEQDRALRLAPRERGVADTEDGPLLLAFRDGRFSPTEDTEGDLWDRRWPVHRIDYEGAEAWLAWWSGRTGRPWRLPGELEWEKAARGVDGRWYPWGDQHDFSWAHMTGSHAGRRLPTTVDAYPVDTSPYGMRGAAGNLGDRCADAFERPTQPVGNRVPEPVPAEGDTPRVLKGGSWMANLNAGRCGMRFRIQPLARTGDATFRGLYRPRW
ncbi:MAG: SUMF1/EgtB/PvdO family nonheme iron enzyme [Alphaproteobacteria bacterium]|nr:SUMF1/EgtB/PvdO family nonheme iron enzyme [Alphaproteobacteria bacterium]MCB9699546.1 SUMF1/EgtB/PvdO family nonheme iron enzyme [Alphaproteobacteria bacterium]